jgi:hypothetical protein
MHSVTLSFATLTELQVALARLNTPDAGEVPLPAPVGKPKAEKPAEKQVEKPAPAPAAATASSEAPAPSPAPKPAAAAATAAAADEVPYAALQKKVFELAAKDKPAVVAMLAEYGIKKFDQLPVEKRADAIKAIDEMLSALEVA